MIIKRLFPEVERLRGVMVKACVCLLGADGMHRDTEPGLLGGLRQHTGRCAVLGGRLHHSPRS